MTFVTKKGGTYFSAAVASPGYPQTGQEATGTAEDRFPAVVVVQLDSHDGVQRQPTIIHSAGYNEDDILPGRSQRYCTGLGSSGAVLGENVITVLHYVNSNIGLIISRPLTVQILVILIVLTFITPGALCGNVCVCSTKIIFHRVELEDPDSSGDGFLIVKEMVATKHN